MHLTSLTLSGCCQGTRKHRQWLSENLQCIYCGNQSATEGLSHSRIVTYSLFVLTNKSVRSLPNIIVRDQTTYKMMCYCIKVYKNIQFIFENKITGSRSIFADPCAPSSDARGIALLQLLYCTVQVIANLPESHVEEVKASDFPGRSDAGSMVAFSKICYIEASDFRQEDVKDYFGLAPGKSVMLRSVHPHTKPFHKTERNSYRMTSKHSNASHTSQTPNVAK